MKVLLINPPDTASKYKFIGLVAPPLGIAYIAAVLEENGIDVKIIDGSALEMSWEELEKEIPKYSPDIVAVTAVTPTIDQALRTARIAKSTCPNAYVVLGGYHPTFTYTELLKNDLTMEVKVDSYPCTCRGPEKPHEHYFIRWTGLEAGDKIEIIKDSENKYSLHIQH